MRIISGEHRGRFLQAPPGKGTRPMLDRVREALFSTLGPGIEGAYALDLFAGSGSLGLESLSRGAAFTRFVEDDARVAELVRDNVDSLDVGERCEVLTASAIVPSSWVAPAGQEGRWADVIFYDPPYPWLKDERRRPTLEALHALVRTVLVPGGLLVFHTPRRAADEREFASEFEPDKRTYGSSALWYMRGPVDVDVDVDVEPEE